MKEPIYCVNGKQVIYIDCIDCGEEIECEVMDIGEERDVMYEPPETCPHCGEDPDPYVALAPREDFHSDV